MKGAAMIKLVESFKKIWFCNELSPTNAKTIIDFLRHKEAELNREIDETYQRGLDDGRDAILKSGDYMRKPPCDYERMADDLQAILESGEDLKDTEDYVRAVLKYFGIEPGKEKG